MAVVDIYGLGIAGLNNRWVIGWRGDDLGLGWLSRVYRLVVLDDERCHRGVGLAALRGNRNGDFGVVARLSVGRRRGRNCAVLVHSGGPTGWELTNLVGIALGAVLDVLGSRLARLGQLHAVEAAVQLDRNFLGLGDLLGFGLGLSFRDHLGAYA